MDKICKHCDCLISLRNPSGHCDHLHYPENCKICQELLNQQKICPIMSRKMAHTDDENYFAIQSCLEGKCALWIKYPNPTPEEIGKCGLIK